VSVRQGVARLEFVGKGGVEHKIEVDDDDLVPFLDRCRRRAKDDRLLSFRSPDGDLVPIEASALNDHLGRLSGEPITAKDFRTWGGTVAAAEHLLPLGAPEDDADAERQFLEAVDVAAEKLGNTRAVCRSSYVSPDVLEAHRSGALAKAGAARRSSRWLSRAERSVLDVLFTRS
jgi:DNA topoisomerase-1